ncbi:MAG TPA: ATP-dependent DNA ligase [Actinomycetota bacterium]|nr:ATP-dependent DNA ligase [Actinomycetota bacterium]
MAILVDPMLARFSSELPRGDVLYEPKWDGFRCVAARDRDGVRMVSRRRRPFTRYFPELEEALLQLRDDDITVDGEIVIQTERGFDFAGLLSRLHPAESRVRRLSAEMPARFVAFDLMWRGGRDLRNKPFRERRAELLDVVGDGPLRVTPTPQTEDPAVAMEWLAAPDGAGIDGVLAKDPDAPYQPGTRAMVKVKTRRTLDAVVAGYRWMNDRDAIGSLLLGLYDEAGELRHIGVASSFTEATRARFLEELAPSAIALGEHPWAEGFLIDPSPLGRLKGAAGRWTPDMAMDWVPIRLDRVCEVEYDRFDADRLRHPARFLRWRPDRDPAGCTFDQLREVEHS